nr:hypothetical protein BaRGS_030304 [Batillaria attramentaria]
MWSGFQASSLVLHLAVAMGQVRQVVRKVEAENSEKTAQDGDFDSGVGQQATKYGYLYKYKSKKGKVMDRFTEET